VLERFSQSIVTSFEREESIRKSTVQELLGKISQEAGNRSNDMQTLLSDVQISLQMRILQILKASLEQYLGVPVGTLELSSSSNGTDLAPTQSNDSSRLLSPVDRKSRPKSAAAHPSLNNLDSSGASAVHAPRLARSASSLPPEKRISSSRIEFEKQYGLSRSSSLSPSSPSTNLRHSATAN
jgi:hypothetical protein